MDLSPIIFTVYIDEYLTDLKKVGLDVTWVIAMLKGCVMLMILSYFAPS